MVRNPHLLDALKKDQVRVSPHDYFNNLSLFEGLCDEAMSMGAFPLEDPLEGIETDIKLARVINVHTAS
jgi:hypothetical protein